MPRIDPNQLLKCLSVLLSSSGGIRSKDEVQRLASLMTKFSKKLVSKCIYILILKTTEADLLDMFMTAGGWDLTFNWLSDGIHSRNWPLVVELVELLLLCPVDIERLKGNNCPKLIKLLSKDVNATEKVRMLACNVVEQWLAVVKAVAPQPHPSAIMHPDVIEVSSQEMLAVTTKSHTSSTSGSGKHLEQAPLDHNIPVYKITIRDGKKVLAEVISSDRNNVPQVDSVMETEEEDEDEEETIEVVPTSEPGTVTVTTVNSSHSLLTSNSGSTTNTTDNTNKESVQVVSTVNDLDTIVPAKKTIRKISRSSSEETVSPKSEQQQRRVPENRKVLQKKRVEKRAASPDFELKSKMPKDKKKTISPDKKPKLDVKAKEKSKEKTGNKEHNKLQEDRDRAVLSKLITPSLDGIGKIPKKSDKKKEDDNAADSNKEKPAQKKPPAEPPKKLPPKDPKKYNISIETRKGGEERPKTVKTFNSKFRSTGLEELPPPPRAVKKAGSDRKDDEEKRPLKRSSPVKDIQVPEKKPKEKEEEKVEKSTTSAAVKPKTLGLQESDVFADALTAANPVKDVKKKKRRISNSSSDTKKTTGPSSPTKNEESNKPVLKFYQDTLITSEEKKIEEIKVEKPEKEEIKTEEEHEQTLKTESKENFELEDTFTKEELEDEVSKAEEIITEALKREDKKNVEREKNRIPKGVLVYVKKRKGPKKSVQWKAEKELETVRYFELDETERVNVTKTFTDMKQMEVINERMLLSRKLAVDDIMEEKTSWRPLIPIDIEGDLVTPGKSSVEKDIQQARERTTLQAVYFNRAMIPDSPAEPDLEIHASTEPATIPLDDQSGNTDSVLSYKDRPWPEPKGYAPGTPTRQPESPPPMQPPEMQEQPPMMVPPAAAFPPGPFPPGPPVPYQMPPNMMPNAPGPPPPDWMPNGPDGMMGGPQPPGGPMPPNMPPGMMMGPPEMFGAPGGMPPPEFMGPPPPQFMGPPHPGMFGPPHPNFPPNNGPPPPPCGPPHVQQNDRPPRPWFRQNNGPSGGGGGGGGGGGTWRHAPKGNNSWKSRAPCKYMLRKGFCHVNKCQFNHNVKKNNR